MTLHNLPNSIHKLQIKSCRENKKSDLWLWPSQFNASFPIAQPTHFFWKSKKKKKNSRITCKEASTLIYKHTILSY